MVACQGYGCLARSLERQDARGAQEERAAAQRGAGAGLPLAAPVVLVGFRADSAHASSLTAATREHGA
jgi:hypothetical protein